MNRVKKKYTEEVRIALKKKFDYANDHQIPKLDKIVVNIGVGSATENTAEVDDAVNILEQITGQKALITKAKKSISNFKLKEGMPIGTCVTLRRNQMYNFFDRLVALAAPKIRDFNGFSSKSFDGRGNYSLGLKQHIIFPEIEFDKVKQIRGLNINIITTAETDEEAKELLKFLGFPIQKK